MARWLARPAVSTQQTHRMPGRPRRRQLLGDCSSTPCRAGPTGISQPDSVLLPSLLADAFIQDIITTRGALAASAVNGSGPDSGAPAALASSTPAGALAASPAAAGATGASTISPAAAGPTGASTASSAAAGSSSGAAALMGVGSPHTSDAAGSTCERKATALCSLPAYTLCAAHTLQPLCWCS